jgi:hypothetical protein
MLLMQSGKSWPGRLRALAAVAFVAGTTLALGACSTVPDNASARSDRPTAEAASPEENAQTFFAFVKERDAATDRQQAPFSNLADGVPYFNAALVGRVVDVEKGAGCWGEKEGECGDFNDPRAMWQWLAVTVSVEETLASSERIEANTITARIGISSGLGGDVEKSFEIASSGLTGAGRSVFIMSKSPDRFHDDLEWYFTKDGGLIVPIASDDTLSLPAADEFEEGAGILQKTPTLALLRRDILAKAEQIGTTSGSIAYPAQPLSP